MPDLSPLTWVSVGLTVLGILLSLLAILDVLLKKRNPRRALIWLGTIFFLPGLGALFYFTFGVDRLPRKLFFKKEFNQKLRDVADKLGAHGTRHDPCSELEASFDVLLDRLTPNRAVGGNRATLLEHGEETFPAMLEAMRNAEKHIHLETYIFRDDEIGHAFQEVLIQKAEEGVDVRILYDAIGCYSTSSEFFEAIERAGGRWGEFTPLSLRQWKWRPNFRNHRKILVVDGQIGFIGSLNIGDEYYFEGPGDEHFRDLHVRIEGPGVAQLQMIFAEDWHFVTEENLFLPDLFPRPDRPGNQTLRVLPSGPDEDYEILYHVFFNAFTQARKSLRILTPYFIPDPPILMALRSAALRGVTIQLLLPERSDSLLVDTAARHHLPRLLEAGVQVGYVPRPMVHAKLIIVDDAWATLGSGNVDERSFFLNYEANLAIGQCDLVDRLVKAFEFDLNRAEHLDADTFEKRGAVRKVFENLCAIFSPLL